MGETPLFLETSKSNPSFPKPPAPLRSSSCQALDRIASVRGVTGATVGTAMMAEVRWIFLVKKKQRKHKKIATKKGAQNQQKDIYLGWWVVVILWKCESFVLDELCVSPYSRVFTGIAGLLFWDLKASRKQKTWKWNMTSSDVQNLPCFWVMFCVFRRSFFYAPILGNSFAGEKIVLRVSLQKTVKHQPASHHQRAMACNLSPRKVSVLSEVNISIYNISYIIGSWMYDRSRYMNNRWSEGINHREKVPFPNRKFHSSIENWPKLVNEDSLEDIPFVPFEHVMFSYVFILICFPLLAMIGIGQQSGLGVCGRSRWTSRSFHTSTEWLGSHISVLSWGHWRYRDPKLV